MDLGTLVVSIILGSIAAEAITEHIVKNSIFRKFRLLLQKVPFVGKLVICPDCFSQWAAWLTTATFLLVLGTEITMINTMGWFFGGFITCRLSNLFHDVKDIAARQSAIFKVPR